MFCSANVDTLGAADCTIVQLKAAIALQLLWLHLFWLAADPPGISQYENACLNLRIRGGSEVRLQEPSTPLHNVDAVLQDDRDDLREATHMTMWGSNAERSRVCLTVYSRARPALFRCRMSAMTCGMQHKGRCEAPAPPRGALQTARRSWPLCRCITHDPDKSPSVKARHLPEAAVCIVLGT